ncbi:GtrA family protein [Bacteroides propionicifaciens]|uniref:GtrA family protein n=1 Tax=Bacteroides propionicifaciens TaxID=392838 RepID=UPI0004687641|nr:GtrA family protein [Bacteroides propionicifaciens]
MKESTRVLRFAIIGTVNAIITAIIIALMMNNLNFDYKISNIVGYLIAQINNFVWSKYWIYVSDENRTKSIWNQLFKFSISCILAYAVQFAFIYLLIDLLGANAYLAQFIGLFVYGASNFLFNRFITFK